MKTILTLALLSCAVFISACSHDEPPPTTHTTTATTTGYSK